MIWTAISASMMIGMFPELLELAMENSPEDLPKISQDEVLQDQLVFKVMSFLGIG